MKQQPGKCAYDGVASRDAQWWCRWFAPREWAASLADLGTFLPLTLGVAIACGLDIAVVFACAGIVCVVGAILFRQPIPPQPMKAIAAIAIAGGVPAGAIAASGILMGIFILALAMTGLIDRAIRLVPSPVVIAIQVAVGIKLIRSAANAVLIGSGALGTGEPLGLIGWDSITVAFVALVLILFCRRFLLTLPIIFIGGAVIAWASGGLDDVKLAPGLPVVSLVEVEYGDWMTGFADLAVVQLPLTLLNSVVAVCALSARFFPGRPVPARRMAAGVAGLNLVFAPLGAMPMCFGSGGLAAQHYYGARTGGAPIVLGALLIATAVLFGPALAAVLVAYPRSILAVMLVPAGVTLVRFVRDAMDTRSFVVLAPAVLVALLTNMFWGFVVGMAASGLVRMLRTPSEELVEDAS